MRLGIISVVGVVGVVVGFVGGCFVLDRAATLEPGTVRGTATIAGTGVDNVNVVLANSPLLQRANDNGSFVVDGLPAGKHALRLLRDDDNDGNVERGAVAAFSIANTGARLSGVDLGPVALLGTVGLSGTVTDLDGGGLDGVQLGGGAARPPFEKAPCSSYPRAFATR
jgi:hypothetical protein